MAGRAVITLTTAPAGTGKSYRRCGHFLLTELLPQTTLTHLSNFPIKFDPWGDNGEKRGLVAVAAVRGIDEETVRNRVKLLPDEVVESWRDGQSGPWDYFETRDISGHHLAIDEIHNFCGQNTNAKIRLRWQKWLGEIRHRGARIEFISQHPQKIAKEIINEAEIRLSLVNGENRRDPFSGITVGDWQQLWAKVVKKYNPTIFEIEKRMVDGRWKDTTSIRFRFEPEFFEVYDSFSAPIQGGGRGELEKQPWERYSWPRLLAWFGGRNFGPLSWRVPVVAGVVYLGLMGGAEKIAADVWAAMKKPKGPKALVEAPRPADRSEAVLAANPGAVLVEAPPSPVNAPERAGQGGQVVADKVDANQVEGAVAAWKLAAVADGSIHFKNGEWWNVGETITDGPYADLKVERIDMVRRSALVGGEWLRVGRSGVGVRQWAVAEIRRLTADVRPVVQSGGKPSGPFNNSGPK